LGAVVLLVLAVLLPPLVNIGRYQRIIAASISRSIGRPVHMSSVTLRLLPLPNFELTDFLVEEKPEFGAEPILRAASVVAYPRLTSLWRGRLEISRIHFDEASLNLVRARDGSWNFGSILVQAANSPEAPTGQRHPGSAPRFPYIEATNSRINFKEGNEKKPLSFLNSDLSVWLDNPNEWGIHFRAQPVRTDLDLDLADTGILRIDGTLQRAATLNQMPLKLNAEWSAAPLGQLSRLTMGEDIGWRGDLQVEATVSGSASLAQINTVLKINGLHRSEFSPAQPMDIETLCQASYRKTSSALEDIDCASAVGGGKVELTGYIRDVQRQLQTGLALNIHRVPASAVLSWLQEVRDGLGSGLGVAGAVNGHFRYASLGVHPPQLSGEMGLSSLTLIPDSGRPVSFAPVRFQIENQTTSRSPRSSSARIAVSTAQPALLLQPARLSSGAPSPLIIDGRFTLDGFDIHLSGAAAVSRLRGLNKILSWPREGASNDQPRPEVALSTTGTATLDLNIQGPWLRPLADPEHPAAPFNMTGSVILRNAELTASYLSQPLRIASAQGLISSSGVAWTNASVGYGTLEAQATLEYPTLCPGPKPCSGYLQLASPAVDAAELQSSLRGANANGELLQEILNRIDRRPIAWPRISGSFEIGALSIGKLVLRDATGDLEISGNSVVVRSLNGRLMNGAMHLTGTLNAAKDQPSYEITTEVTSISPHAAAALFDEHWGSGTADFSAHLKMSGFTARELAASATGTVHWNWMKGSLGLQNTLTVAAQPLFRFDSWSGDARLADSVIRIDHSLLERGAEGIPISGTISLDRAIDLKSESASHVFTVSGTLEQPEVKSLSAEAEARRSH
jgi:hypothetical protein